MASLDDRLARLKQLHPVLIDLSLGRLQVLLDKLGHPERKLPPVIHVAGTNGKGSTTAFLKAMLEADHQRVHVYTSPHLVRFNERISVPGADGRSSPIGDADLLAILDRVEAVNAGAPITFFEVTTAAAFLAFAERAADATLLEVGLGGQFDATNVIDRPEVAVITSISMDHADKLGDTVEKIAREKAGIIKPGVVTVTGRQSDGVYGVLERVADCHRSKLLCLGRDFDAYAQNGRLVFQGEDRLMDLPLPALLGPHQIENAGVAIATALAASRLKLSERAIGLGLGNVRWPARMQRLATGPLPALLGPDSELWLDGGHNPECGEVLAQTVGELEERAPRPLWMICGMMGQKDAAGFLSPFRGLLKQVIAVPIPGAHEAPHAPDLIAGIARATGFEARTAASVELALADIAASARGPLRVLICGSLYLAGHVLALQEGIRAQSN